MAKQKDSEIILTFTGNVKQCPPGIRFKRLTVEGVIFLSLTQKFLRLC